MQRGSLINSIKSSRLFCTLSSSFIGMIIVIVFLLVFSFFMTKFDAPAVVISVMSSLALCIGAYTGGYIAARRRKQNGLIMGILAGISVYCIIFLLGLILAKTSMSMGFFSKLIMTLICGAIGGIIGVNSKRKRY